jgi:hypothetical protein
LLILTAVLLGAALSFAYSYSSLHRAKDWKIDYLEGRLESRTSQVEALEAELVQTQGSLEGQPSTGEMEALRAQLDEADSLTKSQQKQLKDLERKLANLTRSRDSWKSKHAAARSEIETMTAPPSSPSPLIGAVEEMAADSEPAPQTVAPGEAPEAEIPAPASPAAAEPGYENANAEYR